MYGCKRNSQSDLMIHKQKYSKRDTNILVAVLAGLSHSQLSDQQRLQELLHQLRVGVECNKCLLRDQ